MALQRLLPALARPLQHTSPALLQPLCRCFSNSSTALAPSSRLAPAPTPTTPSAASPPTSPSPQLQERKKGPSRTPPKNRQRPPLAKLNEQEVEEEFLRGRGPGGQVINKSSILVSLLHVPTGVRVKVQETRSRETNRLLARRLLANKVDAHLHGEDSRQAQDWERERRKKEARRRKGRKGPSASGRGMGELGDEASEEGEAEVGDGGAVERGGTMGKKS